MKPQFVRVAVVAGVMLTSPLISLAGSQAVAQPGDKSATQNRADVTRPAQQEKVAATERYQGVQGNTIPFRPSMIRKPGDQRTYSQQVQSGAVRASQGDRAFRK